MSDPSQSAAQPWPRQLDDPFPEVFARPPEINAADLSMEILGGAILHHGCLLVRGLITRDHVDALRATADAVFAGRQRHVEGAPDRDTAPFYVPCAQWDASVPDKAIAQRLYNDKCKAVHVADSPRTLFELLDALDDSNVVEVISEYLGEPAVLSVVKTMLRRVPPDAKPSWHQDGSFMGPETRAVDIWLALSACGAGADAPGLGILPRRVDTSVIGHPERPRPFFAKEFETAKDGISPVYPTFAPGDALLFDELLVHANGGGQPGLTRHRYAIEMWMFGRSSTPADYLPILV